MAKEKITFEQFFEVVDAENKPFVQDLHNFMMVSGCKVSFEEKKIGYLASYKYGKPPKSVMNFVFRKHGMLTRIYGEHNNNYADFLNTLPAEMVAAIGNAGDCRPCSTKCKGYSFTIDDAHFQKCRYNCFEFLMTGETNPFIKSFVEHELQARMPATASKSGGHA